MSDGESTPRGTSRRGAAAPKTSAKKTTARSEKKVAEKSNKKRTEEELFGASSDEDEVGTSSGRSTRKEKEKKKAPAPDSDDDVMIVKNVKAGPNAKKRPSPVKREPEDPDEEIMGNSDAVQELPTSSRSPARKEKQKETKSSAKPRGRPAAERAELGEEEVEEQAEEQQEKRPASRTGKGKKKAVEEEDMTGEGEERVEEQRPAPARSTKKGKKGRGGDEEEEDGTEVVKEKKKPGRPAKKAAEENEDEEEEGPTSSRQAAARSRKGKKVDDFIVESGEEEEEPQEREEEEEEEQEEEEQPAKKKRTASRSTSRKGRKAADSDDEDYEEERPKRGRPARSTRKARKDESGDEEEDDVSPKKKARATKGKKDEGAGSSKSKGARRALKKDLEAEALQEMIDTETAKKRKIIEERKKEKQRKEEEREKKREAKRKMLPSIETPKKKTQEERKAERDARRKERGEDDIEEIMDVKPLIRFKPQFVNDLPSERREKSMTAPGDDTEMEEEDEIDDDEVHVEETVGVRSTSDIMKPCERDACEAVVISLRNTFRSVFESKDARTFDTAVKNVSKVQNMSFDRANYETTSSAFYDEIENQMINMMIKDDKETKQETEAKKRVLKLMAKSSMSDFVSIYECQYEVYWKQLNYFMNKFATAEDPNIRANTCFWMGSLLAYSKVCHKEEYGRYSQDELEEMHYQRLAAEKYKAKAKAEKEGKEWIDDIIDLDRRHLDGHALKLSERKQIYGAIYASLKHNDATVRIAALRAMSVMQDEPIPPTFEEAIRHSPKDLIMRQLMDVHVNVRRAAIEELRPSTAQQIEFLINTAMHEKHDFARKEAFAQLGRMRVGQFSKDQRHQLLAMLDDNVLGPWIEIKLLRPWLYEMMTGENPRPIIIEGEDEETRKKARKKKNEHAWATAPFHLLAYLDCVNRSEDVLKVLKKASYIARKEMRLDTVEIECWITALIEGCDKESISLITTSAFSFLLQKEDVSDDLRAVSVTFWLHCLKFVTQYQKNEGDRIAAINLLVPSMGNLHEFVLRVLAEERVRIADRKKFINKGDFDVTHPCFIPTRAPLQSIVLMLLTAFRYLKMEDSSSMEEWKTLLMTLSKGEICDLSPALWEVIMHDLLRFHNKDKGEDDVVYEMAEHMGFNFDEFVRSTPRKSKKSPSKKGRASDGASSSRSPGRREGEEKRIENRRTLLSRPDFLGMVHGALKTALFKASSESTGIVLTTELDLYRTFSDNNLHATCLECIGMFGWRSAEYAEKYFGFLMENLTKPEPNEKEWHADEPMEVDGKKKRKKQEKGVDQDALEVQYQRRMKEELERKASERRGRRGSRNYCVGQALAIISDLIVAHGHQKVDKWLKSCEEQYTLLDVFSHFEKFAHDDDLELAFKVAHSMGKLAIHDRALMKFMTRTAAKLQFRALHPSSFAHPLYRACVLDFFAHFGSLSTANQAALVDVVMTMLKILKEFLALENIECRSLIDKGENATRAVALVVWSCAPTSLKKPPNGVRPTLTAHGTLLASLKSVLEKVQKELREERAVIDMDYYKALLGAMAGCEFYKQKASVMREMYDLLFSNAGLLDPYDKGGEAKKKTQRITKTMDEHLDTLNEIIRQNKAIGVILTDEDALLPFKDEEEKLFEELEEKRRQMGKDLRDVSPVKDSRASRGYGRTPAKRGGRKEVMDRGVLSTLKKEPARSKSLQQTAAAERKEAAAAAAAASSQATPSRPTRSNMVRRPRAIKMTTIDEDHSDDSED